MWRIPKRGRVGESCDPSFLPSFFWHVAGGCWDEPATESADDEEAERRRAGRSRRALLGFSATREPQPPESSLTPVLPEVSTYDMLVPCRWTSLGVVEMIVARRAQSRVFFELLHLAGRFCSPHSQHPYRNHSNLSVEYDDERGASVTQTASETRRLGLLPFARKPQLFEELFGVGGVSQVHTEDSTALLTLLTDGPISRAPWGVQRVPPINFRPRRTVSISGGPQTLR